VTVAEYNVLLTVDRNKEKSAKCRELATDLIYALHRYVNCEAPLWPPVVVVVRAVH